MNERSHALLGPSGAERWMKCTPSARLTEKLPKTESDYAKEGTLAHDLATAKLLLRLKRITQLAYEKEVTRVSAAVFLMGLDLKEMHSGTDAFVDYVIGAYQNRLKEGYARIVIEVRIDYAEWVPEGFGYVDVAVIHSKGIDVIDFKYGKGVKVDAELNLQLGIYGLGIYAEFELLHDFKDLELHIFQPRLDHISYFVWPLADLLVWAEGELKQQAALAHKGVGTFFAGKHCQFCGAKTRCKALADYSMEVAKLDFQLPELLTDGEIAVILLQAEVYINWINSVKDYALDQATKHGKNWPELKLVEGRSNRVFTDESKVVKALTLKGYKPSQIYTTKLKNLTEIETTLGKDEFTKVLGKYVIKPAGKPVLVAASDKRASMKGPEGAKNDFKDITITSQTKTVKNGSKKSK